MFFANNNDVLSDILPDVLKYCDTPMTEFIEYGLVKQLSPGQKLTILRAEFCWDPRRQFYYCAKLKTDKGSLSLLKECMMRQPKHYNEEMRSHVLSLSVKSQNLPRNGGCYC